MNALVSGHFRTQEPSMAVPFLLVSVISAAWYSRSFMRWPQPPLTGLSLTPLCHASLPPGKPDYWVDGSSLHRGHGLQAGRTCLHGECQAYLSGSFRMRLLKNCTNRRDSPQMLWPEGNDQPILKTDLKTRCSGGEGYSSCNSYPIQPKGTQHAHFRSLSSHREGDNKNRFLVLMVQQEQDKKGANIFWASKHWV